MSPPKALKDFTYDWTAADLLASKQEAALDKQPYERVIIYTPVVHNNKTLLINYHDTTRKSNTNVRWGVPTTSIEADRPERPEYDQMSLKLIACKRTERSIGSRCPAVEKMESGWDQLDDEWVDEKGLAARVLIPIMLPSDDAPDMECDTLMADVWARKWVSFDEVFAMDDPEFAPEVKDLVERTQDYFF